MISLTELQNMIHDAEVLGIFLESKEQVRVDIKTDQNLHLKLNFCEVLHFRFTDFSSQNVISRLIFVNEANFSKNQIKHYLEWVSSTSDSKTYLNKNTLHKIMEQIETDELKCIYFEPSCGVEAVIVYKELEI